MEQNIEVTAGEMVSQEVPVKYQRHSLEDRAEKMATRAVVGLFREQNGLSPRGPISLTDAASYATFAAEILPETKANILAELQAKKDAVKVKEPRATGGKRGRVAGPITTPNVIFASFRPVRDPETGAMTLCVPYNNSKGERCNQKIVLALGASDNMVVKVAKKK